MAVTVSLGRSYARSICSIFPLYMELNEWEKSTNKGVASRFLAQTPSKFDGLSKSVMFWIGSSENYFDSFKEFHNFWFDAIENQMHKYTIFIIDRFSIIWKSNQTDKMKRSLFQAAVVSVLLYGCTTWTLTKRLEKKLDGNYTRMLRAILNKSWQQHPTRRQLYGHLPPITKTIQVRRTRHAGHCWRSKDEIVSDVLLWTPAYGQSKAGRPARTYIQQLCDDTGCNPEDLPEAMNDRETWRERVRDMLASHTTWWWWLYIMHTYIIQYWIIHIYQPLRSGRIWHKVNSLSGV